MFTLVKELHTKDDALSGACEGYVLYSRWKPCGQRKCLNYAVSRAWTDEDTKGPLGPPHERQQTTQPWHLWSFCAFSEAILEKFCVSLCSFCNLCVNCLYLVLHLSVVILRLCLIALCLNVVILYPFVVVFECLCDIFDSKVYCLSQW